MKQKKHCPLCEEELSSDASITEYCGLCGMIIKEKSLKKIKIEHGTKYFCSRKCFEKFKEFNETILNQ